MAHGNVFLLFSRFIRCLFYCSSRSRQSTPSSCVNKAKPTFKSSSPFNPTPIISSCLFSKLSSSIHSCIMVHVIILCILAGPTLSLNSTTWNTANITFNRSDIYMACGYYNNSIFLIGGENYKTQLMEYNIMNNDVTDYGTTALSNSTAGRGQFYTQLGNIVYMIDYTGDRFSTFDLETKIFVRHWQGIDFQINVLFDGCLAASDQFLFVVGGRGNNNADFTDSLQILNISSHEWVNNAPSLNTARRELCCVYNPTNDKLFAIGGYNNAILDSIEELTISSIAISGVWTFYNNTLNTGVAQSRCLLINDDIIVIGGKTASWIPVDAVQIIRSLTDAEVLNGGHLPSPKLGVAAINVNYVIYLFYGITYEYSIIPTPAPTNSPSVPSATPTNPPTSAPSNSPIFIPTLFHSNLPTSAPTLSPSNSPTSTPTINPSMDPTPEPTPTPNAAPTTATNNPSLDPTLSSTDPPVPPPPPAPATISTDNIVTISCPSIPVKTPLPLQCSTNIANNTINFNNTEHWFGSCDTNGNYPYLLKCQWTNNQFNLAGIRNSSSCISPPISGPNGNEFASDTYITCCNQVIKDWNHQEITGSQQQNIAICPTDYEMTGCDQGVSSFDTKTCTFANNGDQTVQCHKIPSDQELECVYIDTFPILRNASEPCMDNYTMIHCDELLLFPDGGATGRCSDNYYESICCRLYELAPFDPDPKYLIIDTLVNQSTADEQCMNEFGTHAASIHTQQEFEDALDLCSAQFCCLGGSDIEIEGVWTWYDGSGTFPYQLGWSQGGLWQDRNEQPNARPNEDYACIFKGEYGIHDCFDSAVDDNVTRGLLHRCKPICNAPQDKTVRRRGLLTSATIANLSLNESCFAMEITLNVENILPDPSYILRDVNIEVIKKALKQTLNDNNINGFNIIPIEFGNNDDTATGRRRRRMQSVGTNGNWSINNQCPQEIDNSTKRFNFQSIAFNISCDNETLATDDKNRTFEWEFKTPGSIVYIWSIRWIKTLIKINCQTAMMQASVFNDDGEFLGQSIEYNPDDINNNIQTLVFPNSSIILSPNSTYILNISITESVDCQGNIYKFESVELTPVILTRAEPSSCELGSHLAYDTSMIFGLSALCHPNNTNDTSTRELFEDILYRQHSSQQIISGDIFKALPASSTIRRILQEDDDEDPESCNCGSLNITNSRGISRQIANNDIFPCYSQCIAVDEDTLRVFAVGGQENGMAMDRLKVYQIKSQNNAILLNANYSNLTLDKPRYSTMCQYFKYDDDKEYMMVINGMNETNDANNTDLWYNDIVFIPLDINENGKKRFPKIQLKYNVIDMRPYITERNELYLFGGRDGFAAKNYIQVIDLNQVFNASNNDTFITMDRMEHMILNRVIPFIDFPTLQNETCIMILGGQDYINNNWIDIDIPMIGLQLYCNDVLVAYLKDKRRRLQQQQDGNGNDDVEFTKFDQDNIQNVDNDNDELLNNSNTIFMTQYNFSDDDIWYGFSVSFKLCFDNDGDLRNTVNLFNNEQQIELKENILMESEINYKGWSYGFSKVNISNINIFISENITIISPETQSTIPPLTTIQTQTDETTPAPTDNTGPDLSVMWIVLIIIFSILAIILIAVIAYLIYKKINNNTSYIRTSSNDMDDIDDVSDVQDVDEAFL